MPLRRCHVLTRVCLLLLITFLPLRATSIQWGDSGGYCGSLSIQATAMNFGAYISQAVVRKHAAPGGGHGDKTHGYEILTTNIEGALQKLHLKYDAFDNSKYSAPMTKPYFQWLKSQLVAGHPVVWFIMCAGDGHDGGGAGGVANYDHIEPVWGIYSNHPLDDATVYDDDVIVHGADYGAKGSQPGPSLYRTFASLPDDKKMAGNCAKAQPMYGRNEFYPCVPSDGNDWGYAITGLADNGNGSGDGATATISLSVDRFDEPDPNGWWPQKPYSLTGTVKLAGLVAGTTYKLQRFDSVDGFGQAGGATPDQTYTFKADGATHIFVDPNQFASDGVAYYRIATATEAAVSIA